LVILQERIKNTHSHQHSITPRNYDRYGLLLDEEADGGLLGRCITVAGEFLTNIELHMGFSPKLAQQLFETEEQDHSMKDNS